MGTIVRAPAGAPDAGPCLFLAGGISGCPDWQGPLGEQLAAGLPGWTILDPRRELPPEDDAAVAAQVAWEHRHLRRSTAVLFWFPPETLCPITLYELGAMSMTTRPLFVGVDPGYARRRDVLLQTGLARPDVEPVGSLAALAAQVLARCR